MRTRQKVTAVGAVALATAAVGGGALFTSHAMAAGSATPQKGTMVVITRKDGDDQAIKCTYTDVDLPPIQPGTAHVITGGAQAPEGGAAEAGTVEAPDGPGKGIGVQAGSIVLSGPTEVKGGAGGDGPTFSVGGVPADGTTPPAPPPGAVVIDDQDAREGTDAECAALRPDVQQPPQPAASALTPAQP
jgi:hypothetical protein